MTTLEHRKPGNSQTLSSALDFKFQLLFVFEFSNFKKYIGDIYCYILLLMTLHIELLEHIFTITLYNINMLIFYMNLFWMYPTYWQNLYIYNYYRYYYDYSLKGPNCNPSRLQILTTGTGRHR